MMKTKASRFAAAALFAALVLLRVPGDARACTAFALPAASREGGGLVAKSYDWRYGGGLAFANPRGLVKRALLFDDPGPAHVWSSRYASLTFNQLGRDMPMGGMNEAGLVVEILWLAETRYESPERTRPAVNESQWIQWQLDTAATVAEMRENAASVRVAAARAPVHYFACDKSGACATFEFLRGQRVVHAGELLSVPVLANDTYRRGRDFLASHAGFGGARPVPEGKGSLARFVRAAEAVRGAAMETKTTAEAVGYAFAALERVRQPGYSQWQLVYEPRAGIVHFRAAGERAHTTFDLSLARRLSCSSGPVVADLRGDIVLATRDFRPYSRAIQRSSLAQGLAGVGAALDPESLDRVVRYPELATRCVEAPASR